MKFKLTLKNGETIICDSYQVMNNNSLAYKKGTIETLIKGDAELEAVERIRVRVK